MAFLAMQPEGRATREQGLEQCPLNVDGEELALDIEALQVDAVTFERLCRSNAPEDLKRAVTIFQGEFLGGVPVRDPGGEEWLRAERARLQGLMIGALRKLLAHHIEAGAIESATDVALRLVVCDPLRENAHRALIALYAASGHRAKALSHYESCKALFRRELDVELDSATIRLVQRVRDSEDEPAALLRAIAADIGDTPPRQAATALEEPAIAVLPFAVSGDAGIEICGDGCVDGITGALSRVRSLFVISRASMEKYRNQPIDLPRIGSELGVRYIVMGSMQQSGERIRLRTQLVETASSGIIWSDHYDATHADIFDLQDRITERIVGAIAPSVRIAEIERARRKRPENLAAYDYALRALAQIWMLSRQANDEAMRLAHEAIRLDPNYATAYAYASWCCFWCFANNWTDSPDRARTEAFRLIQRALQLDGNDPNVLTIAALNATAIAHDLDAAAAYVEKALKLDPNFTWGWNRSGYIEIYRDNIDTALAHFERAAMLSPFDPLTFNRLVGAALAHHAAGRYEEAVRLAEQARRERPGLPWAYRVLAAANVELGRIEDARAAVATLTADVPSQTVERVMSSMPFRRSDIRERFAAALRIAGMPTEKAVGEAMRA
jgi:TolB-like protein